MKQLKIQADYSKFGRSFQLKLLSETDVLIPCDDSVRLAAEVLESLDYSSLHRVYARRGRKPKTRPETVFKVLAYGAMDMTYSGRRLDSACRRDVNYMWLLGGEPAPSHDALTRFRSGPLAKCAEDLFYQFVKKLGELDEIKYEHLFVDGTKIEANANKYSFVWKKSTNKYQTRLEEKIEAFLPEINGRYGVVSTTEMPMQDIIAALTAQMSTPFVYGRGTRKSQLQRDIEQLTVFFERQQKYKRYQNTFGGRNSFSKTDPDATFMRMKDDRMRNAQLKPGYNVTLGVEGEYITGVHLSSERSDQLTLIPLLDSMEERLGARYKDVTGDAGFESEENYTYFEGKEQTCYIKPQNYERSKTKKYKSNIYQRENLPYDPEADEYTCPNGKKLSVAHEGIRKSKSGFESMVTYYVCENCLDCPQKKLCTKAKGNRTIQASKTFLRQREESRQRITSETGILLRMNRSIQVEGAFGVLKQDMGFRQFLLRGNKKVKTELLLMALGYNLNKLHRKLQDNRSGSQLFERQVA